MWIDYVNTKGNFLMKSNLDVANCEELCFIPNQPLVIDSSNKDTQTIYCLFFNGAKTSYKLKLGLIVYGRDKVFNIDVPERLQKRTTTINEVLKWWKSCKNTTIEELLDNEK